MKYGVHLQDPPFAVGNIDIQSVKRPEGYRHSYRNGRTKHGFLYVVSGKMQDLFYEGACASMEIQAGEMLFIPRGSRYTGIYLEEGTQIKIVQFDTVAGELPEYLSIPGKIDIPNGKELMEAFFKPVNNRAAHHPFYSLSCMYNLLWRIDESYSKLPAKYKRLKAALLEISGNWQKNVSIAHYAALCNMSEVHFRRLFREYMQMSPTDYRNDIRLANAKSKLQSGEYNVSEVAELCGFSNPSYFIRLYKKKYGHTPKNA